MEHQQGLSRGCYEDNNWTWNHFVNNLALHMQKNISTTVFLNSPPNQRVLPFFLKTRRMPRVKVKKYTESVINFKVSFGRNRYQQGTVWAAPQNLLKHELFVYGHTACCHLSLKTGGKKQQMFSDWSVPLRNASVEHRTASLQTRSNHRPTKDSR